MKKEESKVENISTEDLAEAMMSSEGVDVVLVEEDEPMEDSLESKVNLLKLKDDSDLKKLARQVGYIPAMPNKPIIRHELINPEEHLEVRMVGYNKRMSNWLRGLVIMSETN